VARSRGSGRVRYRLQLSTYGINSYSTIITIGPSLSGLRGIQLTGFINYTLVNKFIFGPAMFLLYHSEGCNICGGLFRACYVNDLHTTTCSGMLGHRTIYAVDRCSDYISCGSLDLDMYGSRWNLYPD
jgi:hypothetical protein